ncbi:hypothetical protein [Methylobacterium soli]|uniref:Twin-arginine translocation signal domain-containing protein n=1 Tax=Methylobacterium soli TaxID=553447 RepID=A0A6L3T4L6_9HYPH|nr:hypothetical protein [Methylobacterium soli]KAB1081884.1 hypothetical protein F6X53_01970 [Methylobacterium soli]GJE42699.1 hypothetical protein AEGHOMDF_1872 [Methylobacterium soli]
MTALDRRAMLRGMSSGVLAASLGLAFLPKAAEAMVPALGASAQGAADPANPDNLVEKARVVVVHPRHRRRRRRRVCWWRRGRRVCAWRW